MILIAIIKFEKVLNLSQLREIKFPDWVLSKWCSGCRVEFVSDTDYEKKKVFINQLLESKLYNATKNNSV